MSPVVRGHRASWDRVCMAATVVILVSAAVAVVIIAAFQQPSRTPVTHPKALEACWAMDRGPGSLCPMAGAR